MSTAFAGGARRSGAQTERVTPDRGGHDARESAGELPVHDTPRYLSALSAAPAEPGPPTRNGEGLAIQRQAEPSSLPEAPGFQLTPPSLLQPRDPYARYMPDFGLELQLDPEIEAQMLARARLMLSPAAVLAGVASRAPVVPVPGARGAPAAGPTTGAPATPAPSPAPTPSPEPAAGPAAGGGGPRPGGGGDVMRAVLALPQVSRLLEDVRGQFTSDFSRYWRGASRGERVGFVTSSVVVGGALLAPMLGFEETRDFVLPKLNDVVIPVPGLSGFGLEFRFGERDVMVGAHLDVGSLLPSIWGFGPGSSSALGGPPTPQPHPPVSRSPEGNGYPTGAKVAPGAGSRAGVWGVAGGRSVGTAVRSRQGRGEPLAEGLREELEPALGADLGGVRIHTDRHADALAGAFAARAFTSGRDLFFRSGRYDPESPEGRELLAHELVHVSQQARGSVAGRPAGGGIRVSEPHDTEEREAEQIAAGASAYRRDRGPERRSGRR